MTYAASHKWLCRRGLPALLLMLAWSLSLPAFAVYDLEHLGVPRFINTLYIDLSKVVQLSKFRSSAGHDYSDDVEHCRSMKHYFIAPDNTAVIVAPVSGTVTRVTAEFAGTQVQFRADAQPDFTIIIFHIALASPVTVGQHLVEGQQLGTHAGKVTWSDFAIGVNTTKGYQLVSYFEAMTDTVFAAFQQRGIARREDMIIPRAERDAAPYQCSGQEFTSLPVPADTELVYLTGSAPPTAKVYSSGPLQARQVLVTMTPPSEVQLMIGSMFVAAVLPANWNNIILVWSAGIWKPYSGCDTMGAAFQGQMFDGMGVNLLPVETDLSPYVGARVYIGYGVGSTVKMTCEAMFKGATFNQAFTVQ